jgi:uncharacterized protein YjbI with pentapeptide repeats
MANREHVAALRSGIDSWYAWRRANPTVGPDLSHADLSGLDLPGVDLSGVNLEAADLSQCSLPESKFGGSLMRSISLDHSDLSHADLSGANLGTANIRGACVTCANFSGAQLENARFHGTNAKGANFERAQGFHAEFTAFLPDYDRKPDLTGARFNYSWFPAARFSGAILDDVEARRADFSEADFFKMTGRRMNLKHSKLENVNMIEADFSDAIFESADMTGARLRRSKLNRANLAAIRGPDTDFLRADLREAILRGATLTAADFREARLDSADLGEADLKLASFDGATLDKAKLDGSQVYGISAWNVSLTDASQHDLVITPEGELLITTDDLEVAQFIYLMLDNRRIRRVIDVVTSKAVLILGRFTPGRKAILDAIRDYLRSAGFLSIIYDFDHPSNRNIKETVMLLAGMARFVIADITDPSSVAMELDSIVTGVRVPVLPIIQSGSEPFAMLEDLEDWGTILPVYYYTGCDSLLNDLSAHLLPEIEGKREGLLEKMHSRRRRNQL